MLQTPQAHIIRHDIQKPYHLTEDEHSMTVFFEFMQKFIEQDHLSGRHDEPTESLLLGVGLGFGALEEVGVVRCLFELHSWEEKRRLDESRARLPSIRTNVQQANLGVLARRSLCQRREILKR